MSCPLNVLLVYSDALSPTPSDFAFTIKDKPLTRRGILSIVSSTSDPLGFAALSTFKAKKLLQDVY